MQSQPITLDIKLVLQEQSNLCWAACVIMICRYYKLECMTKCKLQNKVFKQNNCCDKPYNENCNKSCSEDMLNNIFRNRNIEPQEIGDYKIPTNTLKEYIVSATPLLIGIEIEPNSPSSHLLLMTGYHETIYGDFFLILDPKGGQSWILKETLISYDNLGKWTKTWSFKNLNKNVQ